MSFVELSRAKKKKKRARPYLVRKYIFFPLARWTGDSHRAVSSGTTFLDWKWTRVERGVGSRFLPGRPLSILWR